MRRVALLCLLAAPAGVAAPALGAAGAAWAQGPTAAPPVTVDGPSAAIQSLNGLSIARDGTGGLVYLKGGHVFVSALTGGSFQAPAQVDTGLPAGSQQPVIAAGNGGVLLVGFVDGGGLYVTERSAQNKPFTTPRLLAGGALNPAIQMSNFGKAYLAFATAGAGGHDVRAAYFYKGRWALEQAPLDANPTDDAGTGQGRPVVATAGDGVGIVVWGEAGNVFSRRVWGTSPSVVFEQADVPALNGWSEVSAGDPVAGAGGDSSYATVAFSETLSDGSAQQTRVLMNRLHGSRYDGVKGADGLTTPGSDGAADPQAAVTEYGAGLVSSERTGSHAVYADQVQQNGLGGPIGRVDSLPNSTPPDPVPGTAGLRSLILAWQHDPGLGGAPEIRARFYNTGSGFVPETALSDPSLGPTDADAGLADGGDVHGDAAVAWVQGSGAGTRIEAALLYKPPGAPSPLSRLSYARSAHPTLTWSPPNTTWGPFNYTVTIDGTPAGTTTGTRLRVSSLTDGPHRWSVTVTNPAGQSGTSKAATLFVDTVRPAARLAVRTAGAEATVSVRATDRPPPGLPAGDASGVAAIKVSWGDGAITTVAPRRAGRTRHGYARPGRYRVTVTVTDRAGNRTVLVRQIRIGGPLSAPRRHRGHRHG